MASQPELPLFYNALEPISKEAHANFKSRQVSGAPFLVNQHAVPLTTDEFIAAQRFMPIVFSAGDEPVPLALMGLNEGVNVFVDETGHFRDANFYVPAYIRRYPYMLARLRPDASELSLCFDPTTPTIGAFDEGEAFFDGDGEPSEMTKAVLSFNQEFELAGQRTGQFMQELKDYGLLMEGEMQVQPQGAPQPSVYRGFQMVNEEKLRDMRGDQLRKISQNGMLSLLYAHLFSLNVMRDLFQMQIDQGKLSVQQ